MGHQDDARGVSTGRTNSTEYQVIK